MRSAVSTSTYPVAERARRYAQILSVSRTSYYRAERSACVTAAPAPPPLGSAEPLLGLRLVSPPLRNLREGAPHPARELAFAELLGDADRLAEILFGLVQAPELALGDPALGGRVAELPPRAQVLEHGDRTVAPSRTCGSGTNCSTRRSSGTGTPSSRRSRPT